MADNSQTAAALRTIAEAADDSIATEHINAVAATIDPEVSVPDAFYYAPNAGDYGYPRDAGIYITHEDHEMLSRGPILDAERVEDKPHKWSWQYHEEGENYRGDYSYERLAEAWRAAQD